MHCSANTGVMVPWRFLELSGTIKTARQLRPTGRWSMMSMAGMMTVSSVSKAAAVPKPLISIRNPDLQRHPPRCAAGKCHGGRGRHDLRCTRYQPDPEHSGFRIYHHIDNIVTPVSKAGPRSRAFSDGRCL